MGKILSQTDGFSLTDAISKATDAARIEAAKAVPAGPRILADAKQSPKKPPPDETAEDSVKRFRKDIAVCIARLASVFDYDPDLEAFQVKVADQTARMFEKIKDNIEEAGKATLAQLRVADRQTIDDEIGMQEVERLERRLAGLRVQYWTAKQAFEAALDARERVIVAAGIRWPAYRTMAEMAGARRTKRAMAESVAEARRLVGMQESDYRRLLAANKYTPTHDGVVDNVPDEGAGERDVRTFERKKEEQRLYEAEKQKRADDADNEPRQWETIEEALARRKRRNAEQAAARRNIEDPSERHAQAVEDDEANMQADRDDDIRADTSKRMH